VYILTVRSHRLRISTAGRSRHALFQKVPLPVGHLDPPTNTWLLGPTQVHIPNGTLIGSAIVAEFAVMTYR